MAASGRESITDSGILQDISNVGVKACCGCGVVDLAFGPARLRLSHAAFLAFVVEAQRVAQQLTERLGQGETCDEAVTMLPLAVLKGLA